MLFGFKFALIFTTIISFFVCALSQQAYYYSANDEIEIINQGGHYAVTGYKQGPYNYNYSMTHADKYCKSCGGKGQIKCGPHCWSNIPTSNNQCAGNVGPQTPINIVNAQVNPALQPPQYSANSGGCGDWVQFADDHAFEVSFQESSCSNLQLTYGGLTYTLIQLHFHTPGEHGIGGNVADSELHMVHQCIANSATPNCNGQLLVLGVRLVGSNTQNAFLKTFWEVANYNQSRGSFPTGNPYNYAVGSQYSTQYEVSNARPINPYTSFLPASPAFFTYVGSLTTYPCTTGVTWIVFEEEILIGSQDVDFLRAAVQYANHTLTFPSPMNGYYPYADARPFQSSVGIKVQKYAGGATTSSPVSNDQNAISKAIAAPLAIALVAFFMVLGIGAYMAYAIYTRPRLSTPTVASGSLAAQDGNSPGVKSFEMSTTI